MRQPLQVYCKQYKDVLNAYNSNNNNNNNNDNNKTKLDSTHYSVYLCQHAKYNP